MKWLTTILSLYLLGLAVWPCGDETPYVPNQGYVAMLAKADGASPRSSHQQHDQCAPFCSCAGCAVSITIQPYFSYMLTGSVAEVAVLTTNFIYTAPHWADSLSAIWQPPQLYI